MRSFPWPVRVRPSRVPEPPAPAGVRPARWVRRLALKKARETARRLGAGLVLGADTEVFHRGRVLGKPRSTAHARRMLASLSGRWHTVYTAMALVEAGAGKAWSEVASTKVLFRKLSAAELDFWSRRNHDKAGAYAAQAQDSPFVERIRGDFDTVVGLSRKSVRGLLRKARRAGYEPR